MVSTVSGPDQLLDVHDVAVASGSFVLVLAHRRRCGIARRSRTRLQRGHRDEGLPVLVRELRVRDRDATAQRLRAPPGFLRSVARRDLVEATIDRSVDARHEEARHARHAREVPSRPARSSSAARCASATCWYAAREKRSVTLTFTPSASRRRMAGTASGVPGTLIITFSRSSARHSRRASASVARSSRAATARPRGTHIHRAGSPARTPGGADRRPPGDRGARAPRRSPWRRGRPSATGGRELRVVVAGRADGLLVDRGVRGEPHQPVVPDVAGELPGQDDPAPQAVVPDALTVSLQLTQWIRHGAAPFVKPPDPDLALIGAVHGGWVRAMDACLPAWRRGARRGGGRRGPKLDGTPWSPRTTLGRRSRRSFARTAFAPRPRPDPGIRPPASPPRTSWRSCSAGTCARTGVARTARTTTGLVFLEGSRLAAPLRDAQGGGRDLGRGAPLASAGSGAASRATPPLARRGWTSRPARSGRARRGGGRGARRAPPRPRHPLLGAPRGQRDGGGERLRGARAGRPLRARAARRDRRHEPPRPARPDDAGVGRRAVRRACAGVRLEGARHRRPPARRHRPRVRARRNGPIARRASSRARGRARACRSSRTRRAGTARRSRRTRRGGRSRSSATQPAISSWTRRARAGRRPPRARRRGAYEAPRYDVGAKVATREAFGDALRRSAPRAGTSSRSTGRSATRRTRSGSRRRTRSVLRDVHRRAAARLRGGRHAGARARPVRRRRSPRSSRALRPDPDGGGLAGAAVPRGLARRACRSARTALPRWRSRTSR